MGKDILTFWVPSHLRFTQTVENFVNVILPLLKVSDAEKTIFELKVVLNEAFVNVVNYCSSNSSTLTEIVFEVEHPRLGICFRDEGKGLSVQGQYPPYPQKMVGTKQLLLKTLDGKVVAHVENEHTVLLNFLEFNLDNIPPEVLIASAKDRGMGISLMTKIMDEVRFKYLPGEGNCLELVKYLKG